MKDLGTVLRYLGVDFYRTPEVNLFLHQQQYAADLLEECKVDSTMIEYVTLPVGHEANTSTPSLDVSAYCHIVGKLFFLCHTRPDLSYAVGVVNRYMHSPQKAHRKYVYHIFRYINFTQDFDIVYKRQSSTLLHGFLDVDYLSCRNTRRSVDSYLLKLVDGSISWSSKQ